MRAYGGGFDLRLLNAALPAHCGRAGFRPVYNAILRQLVPRAALRCLSAIGSAEADERRDCLGDIMPSVPLFGQRGYDAS